MPYVIVDTEYTTWPGALESGWSGPGQHREIVQMSAILVDDEFVEIGSFNEIVVPTINPMTSEFFQQLTGISQLKIDQYGLGFSDALKRFVEFCGNESKLICMNGDSGVFRENCKTNGLAFPFKDDFHRLRPFLEKAGVDLSAISSGDLHKLTPTPLEGQTHDALHDCRSMARWLQFARTAGVLISVADLPTEVPKIDPRGRPQSLTP